MKMQPLNIAVTGALFASLVAGGARAQEASSSTTALMMEEIVVSARGIEEGLQDAPIAVSAFTGETLDYRGVDSLDQIERFVPSLTLHNNPSFGGASNSAAIYLRGVGQKEFLPTTEPGVGLYVDGVYVARSVGADRWANASAARSSTVTSSLSAKSSTETTSRRWRGEPET